MKKLNKFTLKKILALFLALLLILARLNSIIVLAEEIGGEEQEKIQQTEESDLPSEPPSGTESSPEPPPVEPPSDPEPPTEPESSPAVATKTETTNEELSPETTPSPETNPSEDLESFLTPTPTPTLVSTPEVSIENKTQVINDISSEAITGENSIVEPTPTPIPCFQEELFDEEELGQPNQNNKSEPEPELTNLPSPEPSPAVIETGEALSVVEAENSVNSTNVNSRVLHQTLNIFVAEDIDLTTSPLLVADQVINQDEKTDPVINVMVVDNQNYVYLSNDVVSFANTGGNEIRGGKEAIINTGDAYSVVSLLNKVNTTIVDSTIHVVTINIFGSVDGNIILPELGFESESSCCGEVVQTENSALVENNVDSLTTTGQNLAVAVGTGSASIKTGEADSAVNVVNIVNTNLVNTTFRHLSINNLGGWSGSFLGWGNTDPAPNPAFCSSYTSTSDVLVENKAYVANNVFSTANTGGNLAEGEDVAINTGSAYSAVSIVNFVNTSIIYSIGFLGFINIFGFLEGDIGGASFFVTPTPEPEPEPEPKQETVVEIQEETAELAVREEGGLLEIWQENNVGTHVLPGDTVTFFVTVKNPGSGRVYDVKLRLNLIKDGLDVGGGVFNLGDIEEGRGVKLTTGLVLSENAEPGTYLARATASGYVGPENELISASADSSFLIRATPILPVGPEVIEEVEAVEEGQGEVLAAATVPPGSSQEQRLKLLLIGSLTTYLALQAIRRREKLAVAFSRRQGFLGSKSAVLRSLAMKLSSFFS